MSIPMALQLLRHAFPGEPIPIPYPPRQLAARPCYRMLLARVGAVLCTVLTNMALPCPAPQPSASSWYRNLQALAAPRPSPYRQGPGASGLRLVSSGRVAGPAAVPANLTVAFNDSSLFWEYGPITTFVFRYRSLDPSAPFAGVLPACAAAGGGPYVATPVLPQST